jgi:hypothetical protein
MKTEQLSKTFPFIVSRPSIMKPLEQVVCMVHLAQNCSLAELREKQSLIEQQIESANKRSLAIDDLLAMQSNVDAAIAYKSYPDGEMWMSFIRQN